MKLWKLPQEEILQHSKQPQMRFYWVKIQSGFWGNSVILIGPFSCRVSHWINAIFRLPFIYQDEERTYFSPKEIQEFIHYKIHKVVRVKKVSYENLNKFLNFLITWHFDHLWSTWNPIQTATLIHLQSFRTKNLETHSKYTFQIAFEKGSSTKCIKVDQSISVCYLIPKPVENSYFRVERQIQFGFSSSFQKCNTRKRFNWNVCNKLIQPWLG